MNIHNIMQEQFDKHGLTDWKYRRNDRLKSTAGRCRGGLKTIELAGWFIDNNDESELMLTIAHEIAHALTQGHGHDRVWAAKCRELGGTGYAYYNQGERAVVNPNSTIRRMSTKRYTLECQACGFSGGVYRRKMNGYRHRRCGGTLINIEL